MKLKAPIRLVYKGGPGSGHRGHSGRPGKRGGSSPGKGGGGGGDSEASRSFVGGGGKPVSYRDLEENVWDREQTRRGVPKSVMDSAHIRDRKVLLAAKNQKDPAVFTFANSYFYRHGADASSHEANIMDRIQSAGFQGTVLASGDHYYPGFEGGAGSFSAKSSFFWTTVRVTK